MSTTGVERGRRKRGQFVQTADSIERDRQALDLVGRGYSFREISEALGYGGAANAKRSVDKILTEILAPVGAEARAVLLEQNATIIREAWLIFDSDQPVITVAGRIAEDKDGKPLVDQGLKLAALDRIHRALGERAKLTGAYAPVTSRLELEQHDPAADKMIAQVLSDMIELDELRRDRAARQLLELEAAPAEPSGERWP